MKFEHKDKGWIIEVGTLTQDKAELFADAIYTASNPLKKNRLAVQAAVECDWLKLVEPKLDSEGLEKYKDPSFINWVAGEITPLYIEAITIPKN